MWALSPSVGRDGERSKCLIFYTNNMTQIPHPPSPRRPRRGGLFTTWVLIVSSLKMFIRNRQALFFTFFVPIVIMLVFGFVGLDKVPKIDVGVVTDPSFPNSEQLVEDLKKISAFEVHTGNEASERKAIEKGDRAIVIIPFAWLPADTANTPGLRPGDTIRLQILTNANKPQESQTALAIIQQMIDKTTIALAQAPQFFSIETEGINARNLKYIDFLVPGIIALSIMQMAVFSVAFIFTDYKEKGILKRLIATPMRPYQFVISNIAVRLLVSVIQAAFLIAVGVLAFKAHVIGSYWLLLLIIFLGSIMFLGLGFTISGIAKTVESVPAIANLIVFPMFFLGGTFFAIETMPVWLQHIVRYMPLTYLSESLRAVMTEGAKFADIQTDLLWIAGWAAVMTALANITFGFEEKRV